MAAASTCPHIELRIVFLGDNNRGDCREIGGGACLRRTKQLKTDIISMNKKIKQMQYFRLCARL